MYTTVRKQTAALFVAAITGILLLMLIYPLRVFREDIPVRGTGEITQISEPVTDAMDTGEYFTAQYSHLQTAEVYIAQAEADTILRAVVFSQNEDGSMRMRAQEDVPVPALSGEYLPIPLDLSLEPGSTQVLILTALQGSFRVGFEDASAIGRMDPAVNWLPVTGFYHDTTVENSALSMKLTYRIPARKKLSAALAGAFVLGTLLAMGLILLFFRRREKAGEHTTVLQVLRAVFTPVIIVTAAVLLYEILVRKRFDPRVPDLIFYSAGTVLLAAGGLYALWRAPGAGQNAARAESTPDAESQTPAGHSLRHLLISLSFAAAFSAGCTYTNAVYELQHTIPRRKMLIYLLLMLLFTFSWKELTGKGEKKGLRILRLSGAAGCLAFLGVYGYHCVTDPRTLQLYETLPGGPGAEDLLAARLIWPAAALLTLLISLLLCGLIPVLSAWFSRSQSSAEAGAGANASARCTVRPLWWTLLPFGLFLALMLIFHGQWTWTFLVAGLSVLYAVRYALWEERRLWLTDLSRGIVLQFLYMMAVSLLHRYFMSFLYTRYPMDFFTVTVTAVYLSIVSAASTVLLLEKRRLLRGLTLRERFRGAFGEWVLFGVVNSYLILTMSRTGFLTTGATAVLLLFTEFISAHRRSRKEAGKVLLAVPVMLLAVTLAFPAVFTAQRIVPPLVGQPRLYADEWLPDHVLRNRHLDSGYYINIERFINVFGNRVLNFEEDWLKYDWRLEVDPVRVSPAKAQPAPEGRTYYASAGAHRLPGGHILPGRILYDAQDQAQEAQEMEGQAQDYSNGRLTIYRLYLSQLNLTGHEQMGLTAPDGEEIPHAHNVFLQVSHDFGMIAGLAFVVFLFLTGIRAGLYYKRKHSFERYTLLPLAILVTFVTAGMVEWVFQVCHPATIVLLPAITPLLFKENYGN